MPCCGVVDRALLHHALQLSQHLPVKAPPTALVGEGRIGEPVAQDHITPRQCGFDDLNQVFTAGCEHQQRFGQRVHGFVQHQFAQFFRQRRAARLAGQHHGPARLAEQIGHAGDVRGLARAVDAFKTDECAAAHKGVKSIPHCRRCHWPGRTVHHCPRW